MDRFRPQQQHPLPVFVRPRLCESVKDDPSFGWSVRCDFKRHKLKIRHTADHNDPPGAPGTVFFAPAEFKRIGETKALSFVMLRMVMGVEPQGDIVLRDDGDLFRQ